MEKLNLGGLISLELLRNIIALLKDISHLQRYWYDRRTIVTIVCVSLAYIVITHPYDQPLITKRNAAFCFLVLWVIWIWFSTRRIPKNRKDRVGIIVAISTEEKGQRQRISHDFVAKLREGFASHPQTYAFLELNDYHAARIVTAADPREYLRKTRGHFILFGKAKIRRIDNKDCHMMTIHGIVSHRPVSLATGQRFSAEFSELLSPQIMLSQENDVLGFEFTATNIALVSKYILGIAAFLSCDFAYAESLYHELRATMQESPHIAPAVRKISQRLPIRFGEIYMAQARQFYQTWRQTRQPALINSAFECLQKVGDIPQFQYRRRLLTAICLFLEGRKVDEAIAEYRKCRNDDIEDATWRYGYAFLIAYRGDLQQAILQYTQAFKGRVDDNVPIETEEFILWVLEQEPHQSQLHLCLGLINYHAKGDLARALEEFEDFAAKANKNDKRVQAALHKIKAYLDELRYKQHQGTLRTPIE